MNEKEKQQLENDIASIRAEIARLEAVENQEIGKINNEIISNLTEELYDLASLDLYSFVLAGWSYAGTKGIFKPNWYVEAITEHLEALYKRDIKKLAIGISPRKGKSSICSVLFHPWVWIQDPTHQFMGASYGAKLALRDAVKSRALINGHFYKKKWGNNFKMLEDQNEKAKYVNDKGGYRLTTSVDGLGTGEGCDIQTIDDPHKANHADSRVELDHTYDWYVNTMSSRWNDPDTFAQLLIHQRLASNDLIGRVTSEDSEWVYLKLPEEYTPTTFISPINWYDPRTEEGELLAPNMLSKEQAEAEKAKGLRRWFAQFQQEPAYSKGGYINSENLQYFNSDTIPSVFDYLLSSWDLADGVTEGSAFTVGGVIGVVGNKKYLLDLMRNKLTFPEQIKEFIKLRNKWTCHFHLIEIKSNGRAFFDTIESDYKQLLRHDEKLIQINPVEYGGSKEQRLNAVTPEFETHKLFYIPTKAYKNWSEIVTKELTGFPNYETNDIVDMVTQALNWIKKNKSKTNNLRVKIKSLEQTKTSIYEGTYNYYENIKEIKNLFN